MDHIKFPFHRHIYKPVRYIYHIDPIEHLGDRGRTTSLHQLNCFFCYPIDFVALAWVPSD